VVGYKNQLPWLFTELDISLSLLPLLYPLPPPLVVTTALYWQVSQRRFQKHARDSSIRVVVVELF